MDHGGDQHLNQTFAEGVEGHYPSSVLHLPHGVWPEAIGCLMYGWAHRPGLVTYLISHDGRLDTSTLGQASYLFFCK